MSTLIVSDDFERSDTSVGGAGSTTGLGNDWEDVAGNSWRISSGRAVQVAATGYDGPALRPADENTAGQLVSVVMECPVAGFDCFPIARWQPGTEFYYASISEIFGLGVYRVNAAGTPTQLGTFAAGAFTSGQRYRVSIAVSGSAPTTIEARAAAEATPNTNIATKSVTDSTAELQSAGRAGMNVAHFDTNPVRFYEAQVYDFDGSWPTFSTAAIASGSIKFGSATSTTVTISSAAVASGGVGSLTYSWHRSQTAGFTPGPSNVISGQTTSNLTGYAASSGVWFYKRRATDSISQTADSNQVAATLKDAVVTVAKIGFIGDSITANLPTDDSSELTPADTCAMWLGLLSNGDRDVTIVNEGIGGTKSADWTPSAGTGYLSAAKADFASAGVTHVMIMLGANDASTLANVSAASYGSSLSAICNDLVGSGYKVVLHYPMYIKPAALNAFDEAAPGRLLSYQAQIDGLCNGISVLQGDRLAYRVFMQHAEPDSERDKWFIGDTVTGANPNGNDWVHANGRGIYALGYLWAQSMVSTITGLSGGNHYFIDTYGGVRSGSQATSALTLSSAGSSGLRSGGTAFVDLIEADGFGSGSTLRCRDGSAATWKRCQGAFVPAVTTCEIGPRCKP